MSLSNSVQEDKTVLFFNNLKLRRVWRYQRGNQNP